MACLVAGDILIIIDFEVLMTNDYRNISIIFTLISKLFKYFENRPLWHFIIRCDQHQQKAHLCQHVVK